MSPGRRAIWKYSATMHAFEMRMPANAKFLAVQTQHEAPQMWWLVDPNEKEEVRRFTVYGTGDTIDEGDTYLGTFQLNDGDEVYHLFEERGRS